MKKIDKTVIKETLFVTVGTVLLSIIMQLVFVIIGRWNVTVLFGNLLSAAAAIANFFLMGLTVQAAVTKENKAAENFMRVSMLLRTALLFGVALTGALLPNVFHLLTVFVPLFFPRIIIIFRPLFMKKKKVVENTEEDALGEEDDEE